MYAVVQAIIDHAWIADAVGDQQYLYCITGALIILFTVVFIDVIYRIFAHFWK